MPGLGCIADDITGGTDLSGNLARRGFRVLQTIGVPAAMEVADVDAVIVSLKSRTIPAAEARALARHSLRWLQSLGCSRYYFKYCSTFDSTAAGNIGPVIDELLAELGAAFTIACPAFPGGGRTVYQGHLFVHDTLLSESGMQHHPLTPMTDANLVRVLSLQTEFPVGLIPFAIVDAGPAQIRRAIERLAEKGVRIALVDALSTAHLEAIGSATSGLGLITGGSGLALGLPPPRPSDSAAHTGLDFPAGHRAILAGSCSRATLAQIEHARTAYPALKLDPIRLHTEPAGTIAAVLAWARDRLAADRPLLIYSSEAPSEMAAPGSSLGRQLPGQIEEAMGTIAVALVGWGVRRLIVAGGETSGAVMHALGVTALRIGPEICPGVSWSQTLGGAGPLALALKSGNFGAREFLTDAWSVLDENRIPASRSPG